MNKSGLKHANSAILSEPVRQTQEEHSEIEQLTREYLARGSKIEKVPTLIRTAEELKKGWSIR